MSVTEGRKSLRLILDISSPCDHLKSLHTLSLELCSDFFLNSQLHNSDHQSQGSAPTHNTIIFSNLPFGLATWILALPFIFSKYNDSGLDIIH